MHQTVITIGNSKGIRIPKAILDKYQIQDKVELVLKKGYLILKPITPVRMGWDKAFEQMHAVGDDQLLADDV